MTEKVEATDRSVDGLQQNKTGEEEEVFGGRILTLVGTVLISPIALMIGLPIWFFTKMIELVEDLRYRRPKKQGRKGR